LSWFGAAWHWYSANATVINPIGTFVGAVAAFATAATLAWAGIQNARTAARRHEEQTKADRQRRITESFSKAIEQLASEKIEARLGGIYALERISRESPDDYWIVMDALAAFVREHTRWKERDEIVSETSVNLRDTEQHQREYESHEHTHEHDVTNTKRVQLPPRRPISSYLKPATDIAAVLTVLVRRSDENIDQERTNGLRFDLRESDLRGADLKGVYLEEANLAGAHLEEANLERAHLEEANLDMAHLERAWLVEAHLEGAMLDDAHLRGADLVGTHFEKAYLGQAHLKLTDLRTAHLEGAQLPGAHLEGAELDEAHLEGAYLYDAHLEGAYLHDAHLERASLRDAHLERAGLMGAHLEKANFQGAHLEAANLAGAKGLVQEQITKASGNSETILPQGLTRPEH
jgi:uncharacterized protein YjbI with pentapeptide repeats